MKHRLRSPKPQTSCTCNARGAAQVPKGTFWDGDMRTGMLATAVHSARIAGLPVLLVRPKDWGSSNLFRGGRIYGGSYNETEAYLYFSR